MLRVVSGPVFGDHQRHLPQLRCPYCWPCSLCRNVQVNEVRYKTLRMEPLNQPHVGTFCSPSPWHAVFDIRDPGLQSRPVSLPNFPVYLTSNITSCRPNVQDHSFYLWWDGFNVSSDKIPQLSMHLIGVPTGQVKHAHGARSLQILRRTNS